MFVEFDRLVDMNLKPISFLFSIDKGESEDEGR